jgi:hypothetical protein
MELRDRIIAWSGWRRYGPAASSGVAHVIVGAALISLIAASSVPLPVHPPSPNNNQIEVTLVSETPIPPPQAIRPPAPTRPTAPPADRDAVPLPSAPASEADKKKSAGLATPSPAAPSGTVSNDLNSVYLGDAAPQLVLPFGPTGKTPCDPTGVIPGDCSVKWGDKLASGKQLEKPSARELQAMYPGIVLPCPWKVGCEKGEWRSLIGTRSVAKGAPGSRGDGSSAPMAGVAGLGGINDLVGRLGFNPDATDPAFGD